MPPHRTILAKFLALFSPLFLLAILLGLQVLVEQRVHSAQEQISARIGGLAARVASLAETIDLEHEVEEANKLVSLLMFDRGIVCAELIHQGAPTPAVTAPRIVGCKGETPSGRLSVPVAEGSYELSIGINSAEIDEIRRDAHLLELIAGLGSLIAAAITAIYAFRRVVGLPVGRLLAGIRNAIRTGEYVRVASSTRDEIGELIDAFNDMQDRLGTEAARVRTAHTQIARLYDNTPAMLFTLNRCGIILSVSDFWLGLTGFGRNEVVGRHLREFLPDADSSAKLAWFLGETLAGSPERESPLQIRTKHGLIMEVSFSAIPIEADDLDEERLVCVMTDITALRASEARLRELALTDTLTGLPNRAALNQRLRELVDTGESRSALTAALLIDLDNFKWVNDTFGHGAGDDVLKGAAARIVSSVRTTDFVARLGGDEFAVICKNLADTGQAERIASAIINSFIEPIPVRDAVGYVGASVGVAFLDNQDSPAVELMRRADIAMYAAKRSGKGQFAVFKDNPVESETSVGDVAMAIERGFECGHFRLSYQPIIELESLQTVGVEALLRFHAPDGPELSVEQIIHVAERSGQIERLGSWVLQEAARDFEDLRSVCGATELYVSVNVSACQLTQHFLENLRRVLTAKPRLCGHLMIEITETSSIGNMQQAREFIREAQSLGIHVAIDDFGAGNTSLEYITTLPADAIKIDRSYIEAFEPGAGDDVTNVRRRALVRAMQGLAREQGLSLIAEGVQSDSVRQELLSIGVSYAQGYAFCIPLAKNSVLEWLRQFGQVNPRAVAATTQPPAGLDAISVRAASASPRNR